MIKDPRRFGWLLAGLLTVSGPALALDFGEDSGRLESSKWEVGLDIGYAQPIGNKSQSILASNSAFLLSDPGAPGEDEFAENGLPSPDFTASSLVEGEVRGAFYTGGHAFYRLTPWLATGVQGGVTVRKNTHLTQKGAFDTPIYNTEFSQHGAQIAGIVRFGGWMGNFRPYALAGAGPYFLNEDVTAELVDKDDPDHPPVVAGTASDTFMSSVWGGGIDMNFFNQGSIGFLLEYQRAYMPGNDLQYIIPMFRFDYHF